MIKKGVIAKEITPCVCGNPSKDVGGSATCGNKKCNETIADMPTKIAKASGVRKE